MTVHSDSACRASKHARVQQLITADENSLAELGALVATLPLCSTGRLFIEVPDATWIGSVAVPARMIVTWLDRSARTGAAGSGRACASGEALARAVTAWADEMLCTDAARSTRVHLLGGFLGTADIVDHLTGRLGMAADAIHTPERFGLATAR
ncbi:SIP domain-containing protein [Microbacterium thalli]|uniref:SIP domain-containing protein n=1 Tax=Microbacterium thalli TaxID=3027921 RepID=A0ABT5SHH8_9MICO|nr:SIP domain-containing protein [Microbacterium thalli]MDD7930385.1 SIP domain-containing protein [Microbacterium thalli]MDD7962232.1 SIP domain-containing protein [Microbacterium thalli]MDN8548315.1 SIP domain-containing protein [Microbacterium thalli]